MNEALEVDVVSFQPSGGQGGQHVGYRGQTSTRSGQKGLSRHIDHGDSVKSDTMEGVADVRGSGRVVYRQSYPPPPTPEEGGDIKMYRQSLQAEGVGDIKLYRQSLRGEERVLYRQSLNIRPQQEQDIESEASEVRFLSKSTLARFCK